MKKFIIFAVTGLLSLILVACMPKSNYSSHMANNIDYNQYYNYSSYYDDYSSIETTPSYGQYYYDSPMITVPNSYHMAQGSKAISHKRRDKSWVKKQNAQGYTIQLDRSSKASTVAKTLVSAPKNHRTAQLRANKNGQVVYRGVYGSYKTKKEAQQAYQKLPNNLKSKANIKQWKNLQNN